MVWQIFLEGELAAALSGASDLRTEVSAAREPGGGRRTREIGVAAV